MGCWIKRDWMEGKGNGELSEDRLEKEWGLGVR